MRPQLLPMSLSLNPEFDPIILTDVDEEAVRVVAELIEVIGQRT